MRLQTEWERLDLDLVLRSSPQQQFPAGRYFLQLEEIKSILVALSTSFKTAQQV